MPHLLKILIFGLILIGSPLQAAQSFGYIPGATDSIPATAREEMRAKFREYTHDNKTNGYVFTCAYMDEILAEAKKQGLSQADVMSLAYENAEVFTKRLLQERNEFRNKAWWLGKELMVPWRPLQDEKEDALASLAQRAILMRSLIYHCSQGVLSKTIKPLIK